MDSNIKMPGIKPADDNNHLQERTHNSFIGPGKNIFSNPLPSHQISF
jgi:hypothetical protein